MTEGKRHWTRSENEVVVAAYLRMLAAELQGERYVKKDINAEVQAVTGRSRTAIEYKFQNVSAVLIDHRHPFVNGYKPAANYQESLTEVVLDALGRHPSVEEAALNAAIAAVEPSATPADLHLIDAPAIEPPNVRRVRLAAIKRDYVLLEQCNTALGLAGEVAVVNWERHRLTGAGRADLASRVEHASQIDGDGLGYDVRSFDPNGRDRFIEVKTTRKSEHWPMLISRNEVEFSKKHAPEFSLYRVFYFGRIRSGLFRLPGSVTDTCSLDPAIYEALPGG